MLFLVDLRVALHHNHLPTLEHLDLLVYARELFGKLSAAKIEVVLMFLLCRGDFRCQLIAGNNSCGNVVLYRALKELNIHTSLCN